MILVFKSRSYRQICRILVISVLGLFAPLDQVRSQETIRLLSDEAADVCIADVDCMRRLFLAATIGHSEGSTAASAQLFKWTGSARVAVLGGHQVREETNRRTAAVLEKVGLLGKAAGIDIKSAGTDDVVNLLLLISGDFARDRDNAFAELFETVLRVVPISMISLRRGAALYATAGVLSRAMPASAVGSPPSGRKPRHSSDASIVFCCRSWGCDILWERLSTRCSIPKVCARPGPRSTSCFSSFCIIR